MIPPLAPLRKFERPLSMPEYYHACIGSSPRTGQPQRQAVFVLSGDGPDLVPSAWQEALEKVSAANPGVRIRIAGNSWRARWINDAPPPKVRFVAESIWDAASGYGADFVISPPLSLRKGPVVELILVNRSPAGRLVIMRSPHAVMDGGGGLHFLRELFRAMRGEPLLGTNAAFSDVELMRQVGPAKSTSRPIPTGWLTGAPVAGNVGDEWHRVPLRTHGRSLLGRVAAIMAEHFHDHDDRPALIAVPVDLRRHCPGLASTGNFSNILHVRMDKGDGPDDFRQRLGAMLEARMDAYFPRGLGAAKILPFRWLDRLLWQLLHDRPVETAVISNLGRIESQTYSCEAFAMRGLFALPMAGTVFSVLCTVDDRPELVLGMPKRLASEGRRDAFLSFLHKRLAEDDAPAAPAVP